MDNKGERVYSKLVQGSNARLFLDLWRIAIEEYEAGTPENIDRIVEVLHGLDAPKVTQTSLSTKHLWKTYESLPKRSPFQFFLTLGKLIAGDNYSERVMPDERRALLETSLYASFTKDFKLKTLEEYLALGEGNEGLYRRDTGKFPAQAFDPLWNVKFQTIADRIQGYFSHGEPKSHGWTGKLNRKTVVGIDKEWIGKESHPLRSDIEVNEDDDAAMEESGFNVPILRRDFNARLIYAAGIEAVAKAIRISPKSLESSLRHGRKPAPAIVHRICARFRSIRMAPLS